MSTDQTVRRAYDATIVRMFLVPAAMELLGNRNWWIPGWLDRILPTVHVDSHNHAAPQQVSVD